LRLMEQEDLRGRDLRGVVLRPSRSPVARCCMESPTDRQVARSTPVELNAPLRRRLSLAIVLMGSLRLCAAAQRAKPEAGLGVSGNCASLGQGLSSFSSLAAAMVTIVNKRCSGWSTWYLLFTF
jgi:hypothetical protein